VVVVVFRTRLRPDADLALLGALGKRMYGLASTMPGFRSYKEYAASDGEGLALIEFETLEDTARWREHAEHRAAQEQGRQSFFLEYRIQVCEQVREHRGP